MKIALTIWTCVFRICKRHPSGGDLTVEVVFYLHNLSQDQCCRIWKRVTWGRNSMTKMAKLFSTQNLSWHGYTILKIVISANFGCIWCWLPYDPFHHPCSEYLGVFGFVQGCILGGQLFFKSLCAFYNYVFHNKCGTFQSCIIYDLNELAQGGGWGGNSDWSDCLWI